MDPQGVIAKNFLATENPARLIQPTQKNARMISSIGNIIAMKNILKSIKIEDELSIQDTAAIEVIIELDSGERRWCFFMTPKALQSCGDWIDGTKIRFHYGAPHMIVVAATLDGDLIEKTLRDIDQQGDILLCSQKIDSI
jgi:hypothetical protein